MAARTRSQLSKRALRYLSLYGNDHYTLQIVRRDGVQHLDLGSPITVKVIGEQEKANLVGTDYMDIATGVDNAKRDKMDVVAYLHNTGGDFNGKLTCLIFKDASASGDPLASLDTVQVSIAKGEYKKVEITGKFLAAKDKQSYYACLYNVDDDDFMNPIKYTGVNFTIRDDASNEQPRLYLKKQVEFGGGTSMPVNDIKVIATIQNTGGSYTGTVVANFFNVNGWTSLATLSKQVTIGYGETATVVITGTADQLVVGKTYDVGVTYGDNDETSWKSYDLHRTYSNAQVTITKATGIANVETTADTSAEVYTVTGNAVGRCTLSQLANKLTGLPRGQYIIRYKQGGQTVVKHIVK